MVNHCKLIIIFSTFLWSCNTNVQHEKNSEGKESNKVKPEKDWVTTRVLAAQERLNKSPEGKLVWESIEAHGGLEKWYNNGPVFFRFNYRPLDTAKTVRDTYQTIDTWSARSRHYLPDNPEVSFGWDGEKAWQVSVENDLKINPRFWSLTPYYFVSMPFVFSDEGVKLSLFEEGKEFENKIYDLVKVTYQENVGDAPEDYYIIYINRETHLIDVIRYIVSYPGFFPEGGHTPEKLMTYENRQLVNGISFAGLHRTFMYREDTVQEYVTKTVVTDVVFKPELESSFFNVPDGAQVIEEMN
ncbi:DUF6503 family protein [Flexithrix dorotheae]|uniref:DUF6503 family protein n=1 Tax=Flexithrix dorotheae TaxID=70993 RepID=UPI0003657FFA|nr:DUF6503 family protein [Flexithrix dorotheae]